MSNPDDVGSFVPGTRVVRGPDWRWHDQDGGEGHLGTLVGAGYGSPVGTVIVNWDCGLRTNYRAGHQQAYDLRIWDSGTSGVRHRDVSCAGCQEPNFFGVRWQCCHDDAILCSQCYHANIHDTSHAFKRFDRPDSRQSLVAPSRSSSRRVAICGILRGALVCRGFDWQWQDQDAGGHGEVLEIEGWEDRTARSVAKVRWQANGIVFQYRVGHRGKVDLKYLPGRFATTYQCYIDHLPVLGRKGEVTSSPPFFSVGENVRINVCAERLRDLQQDGGGHGGFHSRMAALVGREGRVHRITEKGDVRVQFSGKPEAQNRWTLNPAALIKVVNFSVGDIVRVTSDESFAREIPGQAWSDEMRNILGEEGQVTKTQCEAVSVIIAGVNWDLHPGCLVPVHDRARDEEKRKRRPGNVGRGNHPLIQAADKGDLEAVKEKLALLPQTDEAKVAGIKALLVSAKLGKLEVAKLLLDHCPNLVNASAFSGKTALMVAVHQGHLDVADLLLVTGADVNASDANDNDRPMHYAAHGGQATALAFLIERGAVVDIQNAKGYTPLHVAVGVGDFECAKVLLRYGAHTAIQDSDGDTPVHIAAETDLSEEFFDLLLAGDANDNECLMLTNVKGFNALHLASLKGSRGAATAILNKKPNLLATKKQDGFAPLHLACLNGHLAAAKVLMKHKLHCSVDVPDELSRTPLHHASMQGFYRLAHLLLDAGANANATDSDGETPLHLALSTEGLETKYESEASFVDEDVLQRASNLPEEVRRFVCLAALLIRRGANPTLANVHGQTAFDRVTDPNARAFLLEQSIMASTGTSHSDKEQPVKGGHGDRGDDARKEQLVECMVCSEEAFPMRFGPCGHQIACEDCGSRMKRCLECKTEITARMTTANGEQRGGSRRPSIKVRELEAKVRDLEDQCLCLICMERRRNVVFLCGHGSCAECSETLRSCHMCRGEVSKKIYLY